ncbi:lysophospholipid acyltransferase family protein [Rhizomicrobium electricum]|jgi:KDO2-lipid IV(A) lauroyltransferase|uniref:Lipid A biosynthesis lauroyl acyltransferase n=1 Tax=Rhizomicrobium electricum TaxID=480070 RepID=A0ABN1E5Z6_9PROT|nr:lysophospholipid acyltransferase family protein [Rhizomicrobium electricum]NIJ47748.1 KDO2-lipid IV(A) lauroyltransferase [Rhizomicrobium electricum]
MKAPEALSLGKKIRFLGEAAPFFVFMALFRALGIDVASAVGGFLGRHIYSRLPAGHVARQNLKQAYPDKSPEEIDAIVLKVCENLGRVVGEYPHLDKLSVGPGGRIEVEGAEHGYDAVARNKGVMLISGHFANWEVLVLTGNKLGYEGGFVYRPPNNPYVANWISRQRGKLGPTEQITKGAKGTRRIFTLLRRGKCIYMLVDQKTYEGVGVPYFGREALTTPAPASLALKLGSALVPVACRRTEGAHFKVTIYPALEIAQQSDGDADVEALTAEITARVEAMVREDPTQWLWTHRRWTTPRDIEKMKKMGLA